MNITINDLFEAGVHLGHQKRRWNPKSKNFIFDHRGGISIIDLEKTYEQLDRACTFVQELASKGQKILFVATKKQAQEVVREMATLLKMPFCVNRWLGGCLTNFETVKRSLNKYRRFLAMEADGSLAVMLKKEAAVIRRQMARMHRGFEGMLEVNNLPDALFIVDVKFENIAVQEAHRLNIPTVAIVDTNSDPSFISHVIPANDDSSKSIKIILETVSEAIQMGQEAYEAKQSDSRKRQKIIAEKDLTGNDGVTIDAELASKAEKVTDRDEEAALGGHNRPAAHRRRSTGKNTEEKPMENGVKSEEIKE
ncbi:MAG: 30S ribosomal protein S2 [Puniceicoccales bacterium]|jgi:small subunit ribosomal protein S2|nr:30S ribosomal protein S2 [Puniceicoccales bacterium]